MRLRKDLRLPLLFAFFLLCLSSVWLRAQTFNLQTDREPITSLDGLWRFHTGDNPAWANPNFDDSHWPLLRSDKPWTKQGYPGYGGYAWYRFTIELPGGNKPTSLLLTRILTSYQVYADGKLIGGFGYMPPKELALLSPPKVYDLPHAGEAGPRTLHIAIRVYQSPEWAAYAPGGTLQPGSAAGASLLIHRRLQTLDEAFSSLVANTYTYSVVALLFGLIVLGLFLFRPAEREYLWFALLLLASAADAANTIGRNLSAIPVQISDILDGLLFAIVVQIAGLLFFSRVLRVRRGFWWWFACVATSIASITPFTYILHWTSVAVSGTLEVLFLLPSELWILTALVRSAVRKDANARLLLVPVLLLYGFIVADNVTNITYQLGWQSRTFSANVLLLRFPFSLQLQDVLSAIFVFTMMLFLVRRFSLARREEERLSSEFEAARGMQSLLVPATAPSTPGFTVESIYLPASEVGGDFFQILPSDDGSLLIVVGDVSGKGLKAAMTVSTIVGALRGCAVRKPAEVLAYLNRVLHGQVGGFVTCSAALIAADGAMTFANAGNPAPYLNGAEVAVDSGLPLSILAGIEYEETSHRLYPGDQLTFMSDGVVEARNAKGELYGFARTQQISHQAAAAIADAARNFGQEDDITVLGIQYMGAEAMGIHHPLQPRTERG